MIDKNTEVRQAAITAVLSAVALAGSLYAFKAQDYRDVFIPGTVINGINAAEHTIEEMEDLFSEYQIEVSFRDGEPLSIEGGDIDFRYVSDGSLERLMEQQNPYTWVYGMYKESAYEIPEEKSFSIKKLRSILAAMPQMKKQNMVKPEDAYMDYQDGKWLVVPEVEGTTLDPLKAVNAVAAGIKEEQTALDLNKTEGIYSAPEKRSDDYWLDSDTEQLNELAGARIVYELPGGGTKVLDGPMLEEWLEVDDDGYYYRDDDTWDECIDDFIKELADEVDTVYSEHAFTTHDGDEIMLPGRGYYGYRID